MLLGKPKKETGFHATLTPAFANHSFVDHLFCSILRRRIKIRMFREQEEE